MANRISKYTYEDLFLSRANIKPGISEGELQKQYNRWDEIMEDLVKDVEAGAILTPLEKEFFDFVAHNSSRFFSWQTSEICKDEYFKFQMLIYINKVFTGKFVKPENMQEVELTQEAELLNYLDGVVDEWYDKIMNTTNSPDFLLNEVCTEARKELKELDKEYKSKAIDDTYKTARKNVVWRARYVYIRAVESMERFPIENYTSTLNGEDIYFKEYSFVHLMNRHYMNVLQYINAKKTIHIMEVNPYSMQEFIKVRITDIEKSGLYAGKNLREIPFRYRGEYYTIWNDMQHDNMQRGNPKIRRIDSFYRVDDAVELTRIQGNFDLKQIDSEISVYVPN